MPTGPRGEKRPADVTGNAGLGIGSAWGGLSLVAPKLALNGFLGPFASRLLRMVRPV